MKNSDLAGATMISEEIAVSYFIGVILILAMLVGIPANLYAIRLLWKGTNRASKLIEKIPISFCICNTIQIFPLYIFRSITAFSRAWLYGNVGCMLNGFWFHFTANVAIWHIVSYAIIQLKAVQNTHVSRTSRMDRKNQLYIILLLWLKGLIWSAAPLVGWATYGPEGLNISCAIAWEKSDKGNVSFLILLFFVNYVLPICILVYCYVRMMKKLNSHVDSLPSPVARLSISRNRAWQRKVFYTGCFMTISFAIAWAPYAGVAAVKILRREQLQPIVGSFPGVIAKCSGLAYPFMVILNEKLKPRVSRRRIKFNSVGIAVTSLA
eukprot:gene3269-3750_t